VSGFLSFDVFMEDMAPAESLWTGYFIG